MTRGRIGHDEMLQMAADDTSDRFCSSGGQRAVRSDLSPAAAEPGAAPASLPP